MQMHCLLEMINAIISSLISFFRNKNRYMHIIISVTELLSNDMRMAITSGSYDCMHMSYA